jgi:hypothetical protein
MMNRSTRAALTGGLVLAAGLTVGGAALAGDGPAPTPAYVTVEDPAPGPATAERDCPAEDAAVGVNL